MSKRNVKLSEPAYQHILTMIMSKQLMPGDRIPEARIAEEFNISRTPVRDAMQRLSNEGLIDIFPNRFAQVHTYSESEIQEIGILRVTFDTMAVKLAGLYGSRADFLQLQELAEQCCDAGASGDMVKRREYDSAFHSQLARITGNSLLLKFHSELQLRVQFIQLHHPSPVECEVRHLQQHKEIAEALMAHDEKKALDLICDHLITFYELKENYPENFFHITF